MFKILNGYENIDSNIFFKIEESKITRGHNFTLVKKQSRLDVRKFSFSQRTINVWNKISEECIYASSVNMFAVAEWLALRTRWSCRRHGEREVVSSNPDRGTIVGWVFHPTRWLERFSLIWICLSFQILNLFRTLSSWGSINYKPSALLLKWGSQPR